MIWWSECGGHLDSFWTQTELKGSLWITSLWIKFLLTALFAVAITLLLGRVEEHIFLFLSQVVAGKKRLTNQVTHVSYIWPQCCILTSVATHVIVHCHAESGCVDQHGCASVAWRISDGRHLICFPHTISGGSFIGRRGPPTGKGPRGNTSPGMPPSARHDLAAYRWCWNKLSVSVGLWLLHWDRQAPLSRSRAPVAPPRLRINGTDGQAGCKAVFNTSLPLPNPDRFPLDKTLLM